MAEPDIVFQNPKVTLKKLKEVETCEYGPDVDFGANETIFREYVYELRVHASEPVPQQWNWEGQIVHYERLGDMLGEAGIAYAENAIAKISFDDNITEIAQAFANGLKLAPKFKHNHWRRTRPPLTKVKLELPKECKIINAFAFSGSDINPVDVKLPEGLERVGSSAFLSDKKYPELGGCVTIPESCTQIDGGAFVEDRGKAQRSFIVHSQSTINIVPRAFLSNKDACATIVFTASNDQVPPSWEMDRVYNYKASLFCDALVTNNSTCMPLFKCFTPNVLYCTKIWPDETLAYWAEKKVLVKHVPQSVLDFCVRKLTPTNDNPRPILAAKDIDEYLLHTRQLQTMHLANNRNNKTTQLPFLAPELLDEIASRVNPNAHDQIRLERIRLERQQRLAAGNYSPL